MGRICSHSNVYTCNVVLNGGPIPIQHAYKLTLHFLCSGLSDHVRCYHCSNGLRNWESNDDPWVEHAKWYPDCTFVSLKKGDDFINNVRSQHAQREKFCL